MKSGYLSVGALRMYYEVHGTGPPLVLLHGSLSAIGTSFGMLIPALATSRQVIAFEQQAHGRTADIERPLSIGGMADDIVGALHALDIAQADFFGYSLGAGVALDIAMRHPTVIRKLALASVAYADAGLRPGMRESIATLRPGFLEGTRWQQEYAAIAPFPEAFGTLIEKIKAMNDQFQGWSTDEIRASTIPTLLVLGDSDIVLLDHAVEWFRLLGGGIDGDGPAGLPAAQLAVLPGTSHTTVIDRVELLVPILTNFFDH